MRRRMERAFGRVLPRITWAPSLEGRGEELILPEVDVYQTADEVVVSAELPGIEAKDVSVEVSEDAITISGTCKRESEIEEEGYYQAERQFGQFMRKLALPSKIKDQEAKASFKNGVLTVRAPLAEEAKKLKGHKIAIEAK